MSLVNYAQLSLPPGVFMGDGVPIGTVIPFIAAATPVGWLACDGQAVSRTVYAELYMLIGTQFGEGDGVETFNLPNLTGRFLEGDTTAGVLKEAGLPNIEGKINCNGTGVTSTPLDGAFWGEATSLDKWGIQYGSNLSGWLHLDASKSNAVYGNSTTVQPASMTVRWLIKAAVNTSAYAGINKRDLITESGVYTAPVTGWYTIILKGGGGGGGGGYYSSSYTISGSGGGEGGTAIGYEYLTAGDTAAVVIGAGGAGGVAQTGDGGNGGDSTVTVNSNTYTGSGGGGGKNQSHSEGGAGGIGTIRGAAGGSCITTTMSYATGAQGGGNGGSNGHGWGVGNDGVTGGGGSGGFADKTHSTSYAGGNGGDGYVEFLYFDPNLRP